MSNAQRIETLKQAIEKDKQTIKKLQERVKIREAKLAELSSLEIKNAINELNLPYDQVIELLRMFKEEKKTAVSSMPPEVPNKPKEDTSYGLNRAAV